MAIQKITSGIIQDGAVAAADIVSVSNTAITGNIISSQIAPNQTLYGNASFSTTGYVQLPSGTTAQRPTSNVAGYTRFNTSTGFSEYWTGSLWAQYGNVSTPSITYLIVGSGGGGGGYCGGGGGAGGLIAGTTSVIAGQAYTITIGSGGSAGTYPGQNPGGNGSSTVAFSSTAIGGGGG